MTVSRLAGERWWSRGWLMNCAASEDRWFPPLAALACWVDNVTPHKTVRCDGCSPEDCAPGRECLVPRWPFKFVCWFHDVMVDRHFRRKYPDDESDE